MAETLSCDAVDGATAEPNICRCGGRRSRRCPQRSKKYEHESLLFADELFSKTHP